MSDSEPVDLDRFLPVEKVRPSVAGVVYRLIDRDVILSAVLDRAGVIPEPDQDEKLSVFREFVNSLEVDLPAEAGSPPGGSG